MSGDNQIKNQTQDFGYCEDPLQNLAFSQNNPEEPPSPTANNCEATSSFEPAQDDGIYGPLPTLTGTDRFATKPEAYTQKLSKTQSKDQDAPGWLGLAAVLLLNIRQGEGLGLAYDPTSYDLVQAFKPGWAGKDQSLLPTAETLETLLIANNKPGKKAILTFLSRPRGRFLSEAAMEDTLDEAYAGQKNDRNRSLDYLMEVPVIWTEDGWQINEGEKIEVWHSTPTSAGYEKAEIPASQVEGPTFGVTFPGGKTQYFSWIPLNETQDPATALRLVETPQSFSAQAEVKPTGPGNSGSLSFVDPEGRTVELTWYDYNDHLVPVATASVSAGDEAAQSEAIQIFKLTDKKMTVAIASHHYEIALGQGQAEVKELLQSPNEAEKKTLVRHKKHQREVTLLRAFAMPIHPAWFVYKNSVAFSKQAENTWRHPAFTNFLVDLSDPAKPIVYYEGEILPVQIIKIEGQSYAKLGGVKQACLLTWDSKNPSAGIHQISSVELSIVRRRLLTVLEDPSPPIMRFISYALGMARGIGAASLEEKFQLPGVLAEAVRATYQIMRERAHPDHPLPPSLADFILSRQPFFTTIKTLGQTSSYEQTTFKLNVGEPLPPEISITDPQSNLEFLLKPVAGSNKIAWQIASVVRSGQPVEFAHITGSPYGDSTEVSLESLSSVLLEGRAYSIVLEDMQTLRLMAWPTWLPTPTTVEEIPELTILETLNQYVDHPAFLEPPITHRLRSKRETGGTELPLEVAGEWQEGAQTYQYTFTDPLSGQAIGYERLSMEGRQFIIMEAPYKGLVLEDRSTAEGIQLFSWTSESFLHLLSIHRDPGGARDFNIPRNSLTREIVNRRLWLNQLEALGLDLEAAGPHQTSSSQIKSFLDYLFNEKTTGATSTKHRRLHPAAAKVIGQLSQSTVGQNLLWTLIDMSDWKYWTSIQEDKWRALEGALASSDPEDWPSVMEYHVNSFGISSFTYSDQVAELQRGAMPLNGPTDSPTIIEPITWEGRLSEQFGQGPLELVLQRPEGPLRIRFQVLYQAEDQAYLLVPENHAQLDRGDSSQEAVEVSYYLSGNQRVILLDGQAYRLARQEGSLALLPCALEPLEAEGFQRGQLLQANMAALSQAGLDPALAMSLESQAAFETRPDDGATQYHLGPLTLKHYVDKSEWRAWIRVEYAEGGHTKTEIKRLSAKKINLGEHEYLHIGFPYDLLLRIVPQPEEPVDLAWVQPPEYFEAASQTHSPIKRPTKDPNLANLPPAVRTAATDQLSLTQLKSLPAAILPQDPQLRLALARIFFFPPGNTKSRSTSIRPNPGYWNKILTLAQVPQHHIALKNLFYLLARSALSAEDPLNAGDKYNFPSALLPIRQLSTEALTSVEAPPTLQKVLTTLHTALPGEVSELEPAALMTQDLEAISSEASRLDQEALSAKEVITLARAYQSPTEASGNRPLRALQARLSSSLVEGKPGFTEQLEIALNFIESLEDALNYGPEQRAQMDQLMVEELAVFLEKGTDLELKTETLGRIWQTLHGSLIRGKVSEGISKQKDLVEAFTKTSRISPGDLLAHHLAVTFLNQAEQNGVLEASKAVETWHQVYLSLSRAKEAAALRRSAARRGGI